MKTRRLIPMLFAVCAILVSCNNKGEKRTITFENLSSARNYAESGTFQATGSSVEVMPGQEIQITFSAHKGQTLMFATMYGNSWDLFFAPENPGIRLFDNNGEPVTGDVSDQVKLWDAGTKKNNDPRRSKANQRKENENGTVTEINGSDGTYNYPAASDMMKLNLTYNAANSRFTLTMRNNTNATNVQTPFAPGVWAVPNMVDGDPVAENLFFTSGQMAGMELVALAETGNNKPLGDMVAGNTGVYTKLSPIVIAVYTGDQNPLFASGADNMSDNVMEWTRTGNADNLKQSLESNPMVKSVHVISSETKPGDTNEASYDALRGERIAFSAMVGPTAVISNNAPIDALQQNDVTNMVSLYNNNMGQNQSGNITVPANQLVRVTIK